MVLWHIGHCWLFNTKSSLYIYIEYIEFGLAVWHINHCRLFKRNPVYTFILNIYFLVLFCFMAHQPLLFIECYIFLVQNKYIWFGLVWFYWKWTIVDNLKLSPVYTYIHWKWKYFIDVFKRAYDHFFRTVKWFHIYVLVGIILFTLNLLSFAHSWMISRIVT